MNGTWPTVLDHETSTGSTQLTVRSLRKRFTLHTMGGLELDVLGGLSFDLERGAFGVLVGASGSGKSTVLKCIYRTYRPTAGRILHRLPSGEWLDLAACSEQQVLQIRKGDIATVTQFLRCAPRVPAEEVVAAARTTQGIEREQALAEARALLARFKIPQKLWRAFPVTFSGGEQQRINLARAIIQRPRLLLLDEPTASLDGRAIDDFLEALTQVRESGTTILAVFHDSKLIESLATQVIAVEPL